MTTATRWTGTPAQLIEGDPPLTAPAVWWVTPSANAFVLGSGQDRSIAGSIAQDVGPVLRRRSGGGAVALIPNETLWLEVVVPASHPRFERDIARSGMWLGHAIAGALGEMGLRRLEVAGATGSDSFGRAVCFAGLGAGEVMVDGRKVAGVSQRRGRWGARFQVALYDHLPAKESVTPLPAAVLGRPHGEAIAELRERACGTGISIDRLTGTVVAAIERGLNG